MLSLSFVLSTDKCGCVVLVTDGLYWAMISANIGVIAVSLPSLSSFAKEGIGASILASARNLVSRSSLKLWGGSDTRETSHQLPQDIWVSDQSKGYFRTEVSNEGKSLHTQSSLPRIHVVDEVKIHETV